MHVELRGIRFKAGGLEHASTSIQAVHPKRTLGERTFTDLEPQQLAALFASCGLKQVEVWLTEDARPHRQEQWVNGMARKV